MMAAFDFASLELDDAGDSREERVSEWKVRVCGF